MRIDGRKSTDIRPVRIVPECNIYAEGSAFVELGNTKVICTVSVEDRVPLFLKNKGKGWLTSEYSMLPRATGVRTPRESTKANVSGRTAEIQRVIGRSLRSVVDLTAFGERTLWVDCDVIQADGGTRTISITGACVALAFAFRKLMDKKLVHRMPLKDLVAACSVGKANGELLLDLNYEEDSSVEVDLNVVQTGTGEYIEIQGTAEAKPFSAEDLGAMLKLAGRGIKKLNQIQRGILKGIFP